MRSDGFSGSVRGTNRLVTQPATAITMTIAAIQVWPVTPAAITTPPAMVPSRIARKVPVSTRALPPTNSSSCRSCGRMLYFTGPKMLD